MIRIFHTADIHLDSTFARFSQLERAAARERQRDIFRNMMRFVRENACDMVLISGDLFDTANISPETEECVIAEFRALSCPVVIAPGNHDPYGAVSLYSDGRLPGNVSVFTSSEMQVFSFEEMGAQVCGYAFLSDSLEQDPLLGFEPPEFDGVSLLCAHTELDAATSKYAPIRSEEIELCGFTYAALGHIHKKAEPLKLGRSTVAYCGFADSRGFDEEGLGGALSVTVDGESVSVERIPFGKTLYACEKLDISDIEDNSALLGKLEDFLCTLKKKNITALRLTLTGEISPSLSPDMAMIKRRAAEEFASFEAEDATLPKINERELETDFTLRGEVFRVLRASLRSTDAHERERAAKALRIALRAIEGRELV